MKRLLLYILVFLLPLGVTAGDKKRSSEKKKAKVTATTKTKTKTKTKTEPNTVEGLKKEQAKIKQNIKKQEQALKANQADVKKRLQNLMVLNTQIQDRQKAIDVIEGDINHLNNNISLIQSQLKTLEGQLNERKKKYVRSLQYMNRHHSFEDKLMFIFSAHSFGEIYRRTRFIKEYASYQRAQGELLKTKQLQVEDKRAQLQGTKNQKNAMLSKGKQERTQLEGQHQEQKQMVASLQKQQKTIQKVISDQKKKDAQINAQIDRLIAEEVARQQAEARKRAAAEAAKKQAAELARKKAEAEAREKENQQRIAEKRAEEKRLKEAAALAKSKKEKAEAERKAREAEANREAAERKAEADRERSQKEVAKAKANNEKALYSSVDQKLSSNFESNRGRLPIPVTGPYRIVSHFGQYNVEGLSHVTLDNKGINILGSAGCQARSIFDGEVSGIAKIGGTYLVLVRHGLYISVYCNLRSVAVAKGQKVSTRQALGSVGQDNILQFQLRKETAKLNPEAWLGR